MRMQNCGKTLGMGRGDCWTWGQRLDRITDFLQTKYGVDIVVVPWSDGSDVEIASLFGKTIVINASSRDEVGSVFIVAHLFGHMVQFSDYERYRDLVEESEKPKPLCLTEAFKGQFYRYEVEAYEIGKGMLAAALGVAEAAQMDEKCQIYLDTDFNAFWEFLTTGTRISVAEFNRTLRGNFESWKGRYPIPLKIGRLPDKVSPQKDVIVF